MDLKQIVRLADEAFGLECPGSTKYYLKAISYSQITHLRNGGGLKISGD